MAITLPNPSDKAAVVEAMFDRIAPRYDLLNRLLTFRLDQRWRRKAIELAGIEAGHVVVDLGCGTGDMCERAAQKGARVIGVDFSQRMLEIALRRRVDAVWLRADAGVLPIADGFAQVVTSAFALRNFVCLDVVIKEAARILAPGGRLVLLEIDEPSSRLVRFAHNLYFRRVVPIVGGIVSDRWAYSYLPQSTAYLPTKEELFRTLRECGFIEQSKHPLNGGLAQIIRAIRGKESTGALGDGRLR